MTYQGIIDLSNIIYDDYANPFFDPTRSSQLLYDAIMEFVQQAYDEGERNERRKQDLLPLVKPFTVPSFTTVTDSGFKVSLFNESVMDGFMYVYAMSGVWKDPCGGADRFTPIVPIKMDKFNRALTDSFDKPDDEFPKYKQQDNQVLVYASNAPVSITVDYVKIPVTPTPLTLGNTPELHASTHPEIAKILTRLFETTTEQLARVGIQQQEIQVQR